MHMLWGKAWNSLHGFCSDRLYWKMYLRSAWGENTTPDELIDILNDTVKPNRPRPLMKKVKRAFLEIIPLRPVKYIVMDIILQAQVHIHITNSQMLLAILRAFMFSFTS